MIPAITNQTIANKWLPVVFLSLFSSTLTAGAYIFADEINGVDLVTHPNTYTGSRGVVTVRVCINPASPNAADMEQSVLNNIAAYNKLSPTLGNVKSGSNNNIPPGFLDFESVALHEIGHCLGMAHINAATESGLTGNSQNYTKATEGANDLFDLNPGSDGVIGSSDDSRGDDENLVWFRKSNNDPFTIDSTIDTTTYSRDLAALPAGHSFAANADRAVSTLLGYVKTEAVMQQGTYYDEAQRTLGHDDVATLLYAASGIDERESGGPGGRYNQDNYTIALVYGGISNTNCDVSMSITATKGLAFCETEGVFIASGHARITTASIEFGQSYNWFFNTTDADADGVPDSSDNCPNDANPLQENHDGDPLGDVCDPDDDNDGLSDVDEGSYGSDPFLADTDGDNLGDNEEVTTHFTDPTLPDTDGDGLDDGEEVNNWSTNPLTSNLGDVGPRLAPDDVLNASDLVVLTRLVTGIITPESPEDILGDLNEDSKINAADLLLLQQLILNTP